MKDLKKKDLKNLKDLKKGGRWYERPEKRREVV